MVGQPGKSGGRNRKSNQLKRLEGNRGHRKIGNEPKAYGKPSCPDYFDSEERALWTAITMCLPIGLLTAADTGVLERHSVAWARYRAVNRLIKKTGLMVQSEHGPARNPLLIIAKQCAHEMAISGAELGLGPLSRSRLVAPENEDADPISLLLGMDADDDADNPWPQ